MQYLDQLLGQELVYEQFSTVTPEPLPPQTILDPGGAITGLSSNTLTVGPKSGTIQNIEAPQGLKTGDSPTFNNITASGTVNCNVLNTTDDATSRANLGLGNLAIRNAGAAVANLGITVSNPPTQAEVQSIVNKLDELLNSLRAAVVINT